MAIGFIVLFLSCSFAPGDNGKIAVGWILLFIFLYSIGELLTSALGFAVIAKIAPIHFYGILLGGWYLIALSLSATLSGKVANLASIPKSLQNNLPATLNIYNYFFLKIGLLGLIFALCCFFISFKFKKL
jgi:dipeptide/tripeptide permease